MPLIRVAYDAFKDVEKRMKYRFWDKGRERSNRAAGMADRGPMVALCPLRHSTFAYSGPPDDTIRQYVCLHCSAYATEDMIKDMGFAFGEAPDRVIFDLMDEVLKQNSSGRSLFYAGGNGNGRK
jgi:hypothetical protein